MRWLCSIEYSSTKSSQYSTVQYIHYITLHYITLQYSVYVSVSSSKSSQPDQAEGGEAIPWRCECLTEVSFSLGLDLTSDAGLCDLTTLTRLSSFSLVGI